MGFAASFHHRQVQIIDVRDLAQWCVNLTQLRHAGVLHAVGSMGSMEQLLESCRIATHCDATWQWHSDAELLAADSELTNWAEWSIF